MTRPGVRFAVRCTPRSGVDRVVGVADGVLHVRVAAPAVEGAANEALLRLLATEIGVARSAVRLVGGATGRHKRLEVDAVDAPALMARWPDLAV